MDQIDAALAHFIVSWGWLVALFGIPALGDGIGRALSGRRKNTRLKVQLRASRREGDQIKELLANAQDAMGKTPEDKKIAGLLETATGALNDRSNLINILYQVQATDRAYPQLPQEVRDQIDELLESYRARRSEQDALSSTVTKKGKR